MKGMIGIKLGLSLFLIPGYR